MSGGFHVGQAVVCVDMSQPVNTAFPPIETMMKMRGVYRISEVHPSKIGQLVGIVGIPRWVWGAERFRPIAKADEQFTASILACRPAHAPAPVQS